MFHNFKSKCFVEYFTFDYTRKPALFLERKKRYAAGAPIDDV